MKKCKGINKAKGAEGCGVESLNRRFGLCPTCLYEWATTNDNGKVWHAKQFIPKVKQNLIKNNKAKDKKAREKLKTLSQYEAEAKKSFQKWIRLRDKDLPCISCGNHNATDWSGGHYFPAGIYSGLIFDERNVHKQCNSHCNMFLSGNLIEYRIGLVKRFGNAFVEQLEHDSIKGRNHKYTKQDLIAKKLQYDIKYKEDSK